MAVVETTDMTAYAAPAFSNDLDIRAESASPPAVWSGVFAMSLCVFAQIPSPRVSWTMDKPGEPHATEVACARTATRHVYR